MHGVFTSDDYYGIVTTNDLIFHSAIISNLDLWHQRLSHMNFEDLTKIANKELVRGLPKMELINVVINDTGSPTPAIHEEENGESLILDTEPQSQEEVEGQAQEDYMTHEFEMSMMGELSYFLGLQIKQSPSGMFVSQTKYAKNLVSKFGLELAKHVCTPMSTSLHLSKDSSSIDVDLTLYRSMIGSLLYLTANQPDIAFSVSVCARYQAYPKESHLLAVKCMIKYVNGTLGYGIWFTTDTTAEIIGFSDADWAGCADDHKSTFGGSHLIV
ncbi:uncharacterized protein LOC114323508 [Camellia sinensis]|uniref:uncharacterized protein LOC114323508 n=1 Tax=Camellia sinensis TaxID=4442 RepID=UPI001035D304|nr:uncharacterized protein LOC114323508 [Camellia sinensis]